MMPNSTKPNDWNPCPQGTIRAAVQQRRTRRNLQRLGLALAALTPLVIVLVTVSLPQQKPAPIQAIATGEIHCSEADKALMVFEKDNVKLDELPTNYIEHLDSCPRCREKYEAQLQGELST